MLSVGRTGLWLLRQLEQTVRILYTVDSPTAVNGDRTVLAVDGDHTVLAVSGDRTVLAVNGDCTVLAVNGDCTVLAVNGDCTVLAVNGDCTVLVHTVAVWYVSYASSSWYSTDLQLADRWQQACTVNFHLPVLFTQPKLHSEEVTLEQHWFS